MSESEGFSAEFVEFVKDELETHSKSKNDDREWGRRIMRQLRDFEPAKRSAVINLLIKEIEFNRHGLRALAPLLLQSAGGIPNKLGTLLVETSAKVSMTDPLKGELVETILKLKIKNGEQDCKDYLDQLESDKEKFTFWVLFVGINKVYSVHSLCEYYVQHIPWYPAGKTNEIPFNRIWYETLGGKMEDIVQCVAASNSSIGMQLQEHLNK